jgi:hypothetical protein
MTYAPDGLRSAINGTYDVTYERARRTELGWNGMVSGVTG